MSFNRIQKLLFSEYCDFDDAVLIESPFAEVTRGGVGLRQVQIALTSSKFILATEIMKNVGEYSVLYQPHCLDPEIESMELICVYPIEFVVLSVWQRRRKKVLKARFHNGNPTTCPRIAFYELGGREKRKMFWNLWCEKVRFLTPVSQCGSETEASVASSLSSTSLCVTHTRVTGDKIWQYYDTGYQHVMGQWRNQTSPTERSKEGGDGNLELKTIFERKSDVGVSKSSPLIYTRSRGGLAPTYCGSVGSVRRCCDQESMNKEVREPSNNYNFKTAKDFYEQSVNLWTRRDCPQPVRTYGFTPCPDLKHCAGLLSTDAHGRFSAQMKRSQSMLRIREEWQNILDVEEIQKQKKVVVGSQSFQHLTQEVICHQLSPDDPIIYFWTTDYWYKPDKIKRKLAHCRAKDTEFIPKSRKKLFFFRKRSKVSADLDEVPLTKLRSVLKLDKEISALNLTSDAISSELTIIDAALFLKITSHEFRIFRKQRNVRNCQNFMTWVTFGHRVSCLTATQILLVPDTQQRARLVSRFIMVCDKCHRLSNRQSTLSILTGLQSPAVHRLSATWRHVRRYHATAYATFKLLCAEYQVARLPNLTKPPFLVSANFFMDTILEKLMPDIPNLCSGRELSPWHSAKSLISSDLDQKSSLLPKLMQQILSAFNIASHAPGSSSTVTPPLSLIDESSCSSSQSSGSSSQLSRLQESQGILRLCQVAARKYDLPRNKDAQEYLQKVPYNEHSINFQLSLKVEPPS